MTTQHEGRRLPPGWVKCNSTNYGKPYFFDTQTGKSVWFPPETPRNTGANPHAQSTQQRYVQQQHQHEQRGEKHPLLDGSPPPPPAKRARQEKKIIGDAAASAGVKVAVIVPYRDSDPAQKRSAHLHQFVPYMESFLRKQGVAFQVYVVEQSADDGRKFNRGKLLNIGFDLARREECGAFIFHDVDLLPSDELGRWYSARPERPVHIARVWKQYSNNPKYFGGVVSFSRDDFEAINGFPNTFWGWGGEDDEMYSRIKEAKLEPQNATEGDFTDLEGFDLPTKLALLRKNEQWKCQVKKEVLEEHAATWKRNGLADLKYAVLDRTPLGEGTDKVTVDVQPNAHWTDTITHYRDLDKRFS